jgi:hypothetical protein
VRLHIDDVQPNGRDVMKRKVTGLPSLVGVGALRVLRGVATTPTGKLLDLAHRRGEQGSSCGVVLGLGLGAAVDVIL